MASSSTLTSWTGFSYDVFLSFRGEDTRRSFVNHLYAALMRQGIHTFKDNEEFKKENRMDELSKVIEKSKLCVIIFSKKYASSSWCLDELEKIMEWKKKTEQVAYPVFYDVDPEEVRKQIGEVGGALSRKWREGLEEAGNLGGWDMRNREEAEAIGEIVEEISVKLGSIELRNEEKLVGMETRMQDLESLLWLGGKGVRMIAIAGMGGIGKTTVAKSLYSKVSSDFEGKSFVENIREAAKVGGLLLLQRKILSDVLKDDAIAIDVSSVEEGKCMMRKRLCSKKVLIVLDDVDHIEQLEALAGETDWFKEGSRIVITTRDKQLLAAHRVIRVHDVKLLSDEEAVWLFNRYAFERVVPNRGNAVLAKKVVDYAAGLPLTLKVLGSYLRGKEESEWRDVLLEKIPCNETLEKLEISYAGLDRCQQEMFLDVACFMKGFQKDDAIRILESCGFQAASGLRGLEQKCLITISNQRLGMHDRIEELGRFIVRRLHPHEPNKHSRLWIREEIEHILSRDVGSDATTCIRLEQVEPSPEIVMKGLARFQELRVFLLSKADDDFFGGARKFDQVKQYFPDALQFLSWEGFPVWSLPETFQANNLVGLELPGSRITKLWESGDVKVLKKLRFLDLSHSKLRTLDLQMLPQLERLDLKGCHDLTKLHAPAGCPERLVYLNLIGCSRFRSFSFIKQLEPLELLSLPKLAVIVESSGESPRYSRESLPKLRFTCLYLDSAESGRKSVSLNLQPHTKLESISGSICGLQQLRHLAIDGCIPEVPDDIDRLVHLENLTLLSAAIKRLPESICMLVHLKSLTFDFCQNLEALPEDLGHLHSLEKLSLLSAGIRRLPDSICNLKKLKSLQVKSCLLLEEVPDDLGRLVCLEMLDLSSSRIRGLPDSLCMLESLKSLELDSCGLLERLPEHLGKLGCLEKLNLTRCTSLRAIPHSIFEMKRLRCFDLAFCYQLEKLPEDLASLECLEELNIKCTGITRLPHSNSSSIPLQNSSSH